MTLVFTKCIDVSFTHSFHVIYVLGFSCFSIKHGSEIIIQQLLSWTSDIWHDAIGAGPRSIFEAQGSSV